MATASPDLIPLTGFCLAQLFVSNMYRGRTELQAPSAGRGNIRKITFIIEDLGVHAHESTNSTLFFFKEVIKLLQTYNIIGIMFHSLRGETLIDHTAKTV